MYEKDNVRNDVNSKLNTGVKFDNIYKNFKGSESFEMSIVLLLVTLPKAVFSMLLIRTKMLSCPKLSNKSASL